MKKTGNESSVKKPTTLFQHLNQITAIQSPNYWETQTAEDRKSWSNFMVLRFLSMEPDYTEIISDLAPAVQTLAPELLYQVLIGILPKRRVYLKYVKGSKDDKYEKWLMEYVIQHFECSSQQATDYLDILYGTEDGRKTIVRLCEMYGVDPDKIKKLKLKV